MCLIAYSKSVQISINILPGKPLGGNWWLIWHNEHLNVLFDMLIDSSQKVQITFPHGRIFGLSNLFKHNLHFKQLFIRFSS